MMWDPLQRRYLLQVPVDSLRKVLEEFMSQNMTLEHLFDY